MRTVLPGIYTNIFVLIFRLMRYADVCFFSLSGVRMTLYDSRYVLCTRYVYTYDTCVMFQIRTYVPGISRQKSARTYVLFRPWSHTSDLWQMHDQINCKKESYRLSSTCGAPRNHTNVPPVAARVDDSYMYQLSLVVGTATESLFERSEFLIATCKKKKSDSVSVCLS